MAAVAAVIAPLPVVCPGNHRIYRKMKTNWILRWPHRLPLFQVNLFVSERCTQGALESLEAAFHAFDKLNRRQF